MTQMRDSLTKLTENGSGEVVAFHFYAVPYSDAVEYSQMEMMSWLTRAASEIIATCAFGSSFDSLDVDERQHPYISAIKNLRYLCDRLTASINGI